MTELSEVDGNILEGVSATTLWTLHNRDTEAKRSDGVIRDPLAVTLFDAISYDYRKFGKPNQSHALRARAFDAAAQDYLTAHPKASVVALAEGLQSSFWRLERAGVADSLFRAVYVWSGRLRGGLAVAVIISCAIMAATSRGEMVRIVRSEAISGGAAAVASAAAPLSSRSVASSEGVS